jgi:UDP-GlcNAc:undecaprenyl-phosphate/decaprenyl-phosphate GlcNAc-1-phosphate transferase
LDDRFDLNYKIKFIGQIIAALIVVLYGNVLIERIPFFEGTLPTLFAVPLTVLVLLATINAINLSDGLDGLAGGVSLLSLGTIALLAHSSQAFEILIIALAVIGSVFGFLRFNTYPAVVFMGDTGSQFLGFAVGVLTIQLTQSAAPSLSSVLPFMLLGLPIVDTLMVMVQRISKGASPFRPDRNHIHHKLLELNFDHYEAVFIIYFIQVIFVALGFALRYQWDTLVLITYVVVSTAVLLTFRWALWHPWRYRASSGERSPSTVSHYFQRLRSSGRLEGAALTYLIFTIIAYLLFSVSYPKKIPYDIGVLASAMAALQLIMALYFGTKPLVAMERIGLYVTIGVAIYLMQNSPPIPVFGGKIEQVIFISMVVAGMVAIRYSTQPSKFQFTPLDFLMLLIILVLPRVLDLQAVNSTNWQLGLAKLAVLFYIIELLLNRLTSWRRSFRLAQVALLAFGGFRAILGF